MTRKPNPLRKRAKKRRARPVVVVPPPLKQIGVPDPKGAPLSDDIAPATEPLFTPAFIRMIRRRAVENAPDRSIM